MEYVFYCDSLSFKKQTSFHLVKEHNETAFKETWHYTLEKGEVIYFQVRYNSGDAEMNEVYYVKNNKLVCMEVFEAVYHPMFEDDVKRGEVFYFDSGRIIRYTRLGKPLTDDNNAYWLQKKFQNRYYELSKNLRW